MPKDFGGGTTTVIPPYDAANAIVGSSRPRLIELRSRCPYVSRAAGTAGSTGIDTGRRRAGTRRRSARHPESQAAVRVGLGAVLIAHRLQKLFGWWDGQGLAGFPNCPLVTSTPSPRLCERWRQVVASAAWCLGCLLRRRTRGALAFLINGLLAGISAQHSRPSAYFWDGHEYQITLVVMAVAVILVVPGRYGLDAARGQAHRPLIGSKFVALLGASRRVLPYGCCSTGQIHWPEHVIGTGWGPVELASVRCGSIAKVTAGNRSSVPSLSVAHPGPAVEPRPMLSQRTARLPTSVRTVTPPLVGERAGRMIDADSATRND